MASITVVKELRLRTTGLKLSSQILIAISAFVSSCIQAAPVESSSTSALDTLLALQTSTASSLPEFYSISDKIQILVESTQKALNVEITQKGRKIE
jgi:hypothetical protein